MTGNGRGGGSYLVQLLRQLGYRATVRNVSADQFFTAAGDSSRKIQIGFAVWGADFPTASDFFLPVLTCRSFYQDPASTDNLAEFCDPHADELASQAQAAQLTDPPPPGGCGRRLDRIVTDQAPWVPIFNRVRHCVRLRPGRELPGIPVLRARCSTRSGSSSAPLQPGLRRYPSPGL